MITLNKPFIAVAALIVLLLLGAAYFLGTRNQPDTGRFTPVPNMNGGFMFDHKTAQVCWAGHPDGNLSNPPLPLCKDLIKN